MFILAHRADAGQQFPNYLAALQVYKKCEIDFLLRRLTLTSSLQTLHLKLSISILCLQKRFSPTHGTGRAVSSKNGSQTNGFHGEVPHTIGD